MAEMKKDLVLKVEGLKTRFKVDKKIVNAVNGVNFELKRGKTLCVVGESGCGKSVTAHSIMQLLPKTGYIEDGFVDYSPVEGETVRLTDYKRTSKQIREIRGKDIAMIFQDPMTSLNPVYTIGSQIVENLRKHEKLTKEEAKARVIKLLEDLGIPEAEKRFDDYPHQFSGGMRQRVMIAIAMVCNPKILIADEPTTALDVTIEAQILKLMKQLRDEHGTSILMITHNMGVVAQMCDYVYVMYAGKVMEQAETFELFRNTCHPYTSGLLRSIPKMDSHVDRLYSIPGVVPNLLHLPKGCSFCTRCPYADDYCRENRPELYDVESAEPHKVRCFRMEKGGDQNG